MVLLSLGGLPWLSPGAVGPKSFSDVTECAGTHMVRATHGTHPGRTLPTTANLAQNQATQQVRRRFKRSQLQFLFRNWSPRHPPTWTCWSASGVDHLTICPQDLSASGQVCAAISTTSRYKLLAVSAILSLSMCSSSTRGRVICALPSGLTMDPTKIRTSSLITTLRGKLVQCVFPAPTVRPVTNKWHLVHRRIPCWPPVLFTRVHSPSFVEPASNTLSTLHECNIYILVKLFRSQWYRNDARWRKGAAFTEKMNVEFEDEEFTAADGGLRGSEPSMQSAMTHHLSSLVATRASSRVSVRKWNCGFCSRALQLNCKGLVFWAGCRGCGHWQRNDPDPGDTGVRFPGWTWNGALRCSGHFLWKLYDYALRVQSNVRELAKQGIRLPDQVQGVLPLRRANLSTQAHWRATTCLLAMWGRHASATPTGACETQRNTTRTSRIQSMCHKQKKQGLHQRNRKERYWRGDRSCSPERGQRHQFRRNRCSRDTAGSQGVTRVNSEPRVHPTSRNWSHAHSVASIARKDIGHANARTKENNCQEVAKRQKHHSLSTLEETTARHVTLDRKWLTQAAHVSWLDKQPWKNGNGCSQQNGRLSMQKIKLDKAMTIRFGDVETLEI